MNFSLNKLSYVVFCVCIFSLLAFSSWGAGEPRWEEVSSLPTISSNWWLEDTDFISENEGWAVGGDAEGGTGIILHFKDDTWTRFDLSNLTEILGTNWYLTDVYFDGPWRGWATGINLQTNKGIILTYYYDKKKTEWVWLNTPLFGITGTKDWDLQGVCFDGQGYGWAAGADRENRQGIILRGEESMGVEGLAFWDKADVPNVGSANWRLWDIDADTDGVVWAAGDDLENGRGVIIKCENQRDWLKVEVPEVSTDWWLTGVSFPSAGEGWAVGNNWEQFFGNNWNSVQFSGVLLHYKNNAWNSVTPPLVSPTWSLTGCLFPSPEKGWATGEDVNFKFYGERGVVLTYRNGNWEETSDVLPSFGQRWVLNGLDFPTRFQGWAVGENPDEEAGTNRGIMLHYWEACTIDADCDDGIYCNGEEICNEDGACEQGGLPCPDDGQFCNGEESCDEGTGECLHSGSPCMPEETCDEADDKCRCEQDSDCSYLDEGCTVGVCSLSEGICIEETAEDGTSCDDGLYCNGEETCQNGDCESGAPPDCSDDGLFCNGTETGCDEANNQCAHSGNPCSSSETCNEITDECVSSSGGGNGGGGGGGGGNPPPDNNPPSAPSNPDPTDGAVNQPVHLTFSWTASVDPDGDTVSYDIYLGRSTELSLVVSNYPENKYTHSTLAYDTAYSWKIVAKDENGAEASSPVWSFTTEVEQQNSPPSVPLSPLPSSGSIAQPINIVLSWEPSTDPDGDDVSYDLFFGKNNPPPRIAAGLKKNTYTIKGLEENTTYYWFILVTDSKGASTQGTVWSFTTTDSEKPPPDDLATIQTHVFDILLGSPVVNASVVVNPGGYESVSDEQGLCSFNLPEGLYTIDVSAENYLSQHMTNVAVSNFVWLEVGLVPLTCPVATALGREENALSIFRQYRNLILSGSREGRHIIQIYYTYGPEFTAFLLENTDLKGKAAAILLRLLPVIKQTLRHNTGIVPPDIDRKIKRFLKDAKKRADTPLRTVIQNLERQWESGALLKTLSLKRR